MIQTREEYEAARRRLEGFRHMLWHFGVQLIETWGIGSLTVGATLSEALSGISDVVPWVAMQEYADAHGLPYPDDGLRLGGPCPDHLRTTAGTA